MEKVKSMPSGISGKYKWYTLDDLITIKGLLFSEDKEEYLEGITILIEMALLTKKYANKLNHYDWMYEDDRK